MKKVFSLLPLLFFIISCNNDDTPSFESQFYGEWKLISMQGMAETQPRTGSDMLWQESYTFREGFTIIKRRVQEGETTEISGTFERFIGNGMFPAVTINYETDSEIIGRCFDTGDESVYIESPGLLRNEWEQCDGPILIYAKQ